MTIKLGDPIPPINLKILSANGLQDISTTRLFQGNVILFGLPGAFLPECSDRHLPDYLDKADFPKRNGIDQIICMAVNDPYVMEAWAKEKRIGTKVLMLPDGNGAFTKALGLQLDGRNYNIGTRCQRFAMLVENGIVSDLQIDQDPEDVDASSALCMLGRLENRIVPENKMRTKLSSY